MRREVAIVGGGPAGLSAALILGRCRRDVVLLDSRKYRNADAHAMHGYLTRDGTPPDELRRLAREELARYPSVELRDATVVDARRDGGAWILEIERGPPVTARALLLATGLVDVLPELPGARELHGRRLFPCPYCDGWELLDQPLVALTQPDARGVLFAKVLAQWTHDLVLCTNGPSRCDRAQLALAGVALDERPIAWLRDDGEALVIGFADGTTMRRAAMFYHLGARPRSDLAARLGARVDHEGGVEADRHEHTTVEGLWVAGDASRDALMAIVGAGEGASAAMSINAWLACG